MKILGNIIKSQSDNRLYQAIKLKNQIECLIISDQEAKKSSAAMSVGVGSLQDPMEAQGLAHYLEHMLFMGTKKYPEQNDYANFIAKNFGMSNAYTSQQQTNFHFEVASNAFEDTLDRFAQFFICPIMSDSSSERQLNAVHSEHSKNVLNDMWRKFQLSKHIAKKGHPFNKFSTGDKNSLSHPNLRGLLHNFYDQNYSSNLMKLVVYGNRAPEQLTKIVEEKFSNVPNKKYQKFEMLDLPYHSDSYQKIYKIAPIQDKKTLQLVWTLPDQSKYYENCPGHYLSHLVGHEGKGSLLSFLIKEGLATALSCMSHNCYDLYSQFQVSLTLTSQGLKKVDEVVRYVLYFIEMLKQSQPQEWVFREIQKVSKMRFDFKQKTQGMSFVSGLAKRLQNHKIQEVLAYPYFMKDWKPQLIKKYLTNLHAKNLMIFLQAKEIEKSCNLTEPIYQTKYGITEIQNTKPLVCPVQLPEANPFIPEDFTILPMGSNQYPEKMQESSNHRIESYYKKDHKFMLPKVIIYMRFYFPGNFSAKEAVARRIYWDMLNEKLRQFVYLSETAGLGSSVSFNSHFSAEVVVSGFRDSVNKFIQPFLSQAFEFKPSDLKYFQSVKEKLQRSYANYFLGDPFRMAYGYLINSVRHGIDVSPEDKLFEVQQIEFEDIIDFGKRWNKSLYLQNYITGNIEKQQAEGIQKKIEEIVAKKSKVLPRKKIQQIRAVELPPRKTWVIEKKLQSKQEENSAVIVHFQHEATTIRSKLLQDLCIYFIKEPAFDYLRTKQQLGYIVMCMPDDNRGVLGVSILVQSAIKTSYELSGYVDIFLKDILRQKHRNLDEATFSAFKESLRNSKEEKDKNLYSQSSRFWNQICNHAYLFNRKEVQLQELQSISLQQFKNFIELIFYINSKRVQVHMISHRNYEKNCQLQKERLASDQSVRVLADPETFRKKMSLYPDFYGHL